MTGKRVFKRRIWSGNDDAVCPFDCLKRADLRWCPIAVFLLSLVVSPAARAGTWDSILSNSHWYVPQENLLAYMSSSTSFTTPPPISLWDQTLWSLGTATEGRFTGSAQATFYISPENSFSSSDSILGIATESGQIRMRFTPSSGGSPVIGIGQFRQVDGTTAMQMQMISGQAGEAYTTHWAYMLPYTPGSFTPPDPRPNTALTSTEWAWTLGTTWAYQSDQLFGPGGMGNFTITHYRNGYFWGSGSGPTGALGESFTQLGSITPEGNVLFNVLTGQSVPTLVTLTGQITGGPLTGQMALRTYEFSGSDPAFGPVGVAAVVPEPVAWLMAVAGITAAGAARHFRQRSGSGTRSRVQRFAPRKSQGWWEPRHSPTRMKP